MHALLRGATLLWFLARDPEQLKTPEAPPTVASLALVCAERDASAAEELEAALQRGESPNTIAEILSRIGHCADAE